jgi:hypothetical protein
LRFRFFFGRNIISDRSSLKIRGRTLNAKQRAGFTAKVEALFGEFIHAIERDQYSPAEVIQAACNVIAAAIDETGDKDLAIQATQRWISTSLERARAVDQMRYPAGSTDTSY